MDGGQDAAWRGCAGASGLGAVRPGVGAGATPRPLFPFPLIEGRGEEALFAALPEPAQLSVRTSRGLLRLGRRAPLAAKVHGVAQDRGNRFSGRFGRRFSRLVRWTAAGFCGASRAGDGGRLRRDGVGRRALGREYRVRCGAGLAGVVWRGHITASGPPACGVSRDGRRAGRRGRGRGRSR